VARVAYRLVVVTKPGAETGESQVVVFLESAHLGRTQDERLAFARCVGLAVGRFESVHFGLGR
jgi:hypothetical protein